MAYMPIPFGYSKLLECYVAYSCIPCPPPPTTIRSLTAISVPLSPQKKIKCQMSTIMVGGSSPWSSPQVPIKNIERELICPICKELFTHPLILPCQHSVCHKCIRELLMLNHDDSFDAGSECSMPGSPRSRVPSPSMERLDRLVRSGGSRGKETLSLFCFVLFGFCCVVLNNCFVVVVTCRIVC